MPEHPSDILGDADDALGGIIDLLCAVQPRQGLNEVAPGNLLALLALVRCRIRDAEKRITQG